MSPTAEQIAHIERTGRWWETLARSRTAGRILGWLMVCDPPHQSSAELVEALHTSAGSVSTQSRLLENIGLVERVTFPGDRATYYQLRPNVWIEMMRVEQDRLVAVKALADAATDLVPVARPDRVTGLQQVMSVFLDEWPGLLRRLEAMTEKASAS